MKLSQFIIIALFNVVFGFALLAEPVNEAEIAALITPPYSLGAAEDIDGVWKLLNGSGLQEGYAIQSEVISPLPGFSGSPLNILILVDDQGVMIDAKLINQSEPIFVSGLGEAPLNQFLEQYRGHAITEGIVVGNKYGESGGASSALVYLDGVTKATASVRIAHESILSAAREVAKRKLAGVNFVSLSAEPKPDYDETLDWEKLVDEGIAKNLTLTNAEIDTLFADTLWRDDDPDARNDPNGIYLGLWLVDISPPAIAKAVLSPRALEELTRQRRINPTDEYLLLIDEGRHGLVSPDFTRNTSPDWITAKQAELPVALRDADIANDFNHDVPRGASIILRADRRLGFLPTEPWTIEILATREHGSFQPETGSVTLTRDYVAPARFYNITTPPKARPQWLEAIYNRAPSLITVLFILGLSIATMANNATFATWRHYSQYRLTFLAVVAIFVGWVAQAQLSIVTPLATLSAIISDKSLGFLLYDPVSLAVWVAAIIGLVFWGRAHFCGWLCPFGAIQEWVGAFARRANMRQWDIPERAERHALSIKYIVLGVLVAVALFAPANIDKAAEVEPFKTAISVSFQRQWFFVGYALLCTFASLVSYKAFCRFLCPLGAFMAVFGRFRTQNWIERRAECGSPCQLCAVKCRYNAIPKTGEINYGECFGCLDCVRIFESETECVARVLANKQKPLKNRSGVHA